jgi:altronate dehydratase large subunit
VTEGFLGYRRADGRIGVRNHVLVLPTSDLVLHAAQLVSRAEPDAAVVTQWSAPAGSDRDFVRRVTAGFVTNPNVGHVVLIDLGDGDDLATDVAGRVAHVVPVDVVTVARAGGVRAAADRAAALATKARARLASDERVPCALSELLVGTECGGSDSYSGLTANPALGEAVDRLVAMGGGALLCEMPELIGAEHLLAARAIDAEVAADLVAAVKSWEQLVVDFGEDLRGAQPSPGNQAGGLTTIEEKSLGAVAKGGKSPLVEVVGYGERPRRRGLIAMDTPGHDIEQLTAMAAGGAQVVVFTTGRGTPTASPIMPTIKVSTNTALAVALADHIDVDAGVILDGTPKASVAARIFDEIVAVANGKLTAGERFGQRDFALPRTAPGWHRTGMPA